MWRMSGGITAWSFHVNSFCVECGLSYQIACISFIAVAKRMNSWYENVTKQTRFGICLSLYFWKYTVRLDAKQHAHKILFTLAFVIFVWFTLLRYCSDLSRKGIALFNRMLLAYIWCNLMDHKYWMRFGFASLSAQSQFSVSAALSDK